MRWHGAGPGGCHCATDALAWIQRSEAGGARFRLVELRRVDDRVLLHATVEPGDRELHQIATLDATGRITRLLDYTDPAVAERDMRGMAAAAPADPAVGVGRLVPFVDVRDVTASVAFYRLLGFAVTGEHRGEGRLVWAALRSGAAELMLAEGAEPVDAGRRGVLFYLYADDLAGLREHLRATAPARARSPTAPPAPLRRCAWTTRTATAS